MNSRVIKKLDKIKDLQTSSVKRNHVLKLLSDEAQNASKVDSTFFKVLELDLDNEHQAQVNAALD